MRRPLRPSLTEHVFSVQTEEYVGRFARELTSYNVKSVRDVDWSTHPGWIKDLFVPSVSETMFKQLLTDLQLEQLQTLMTFALQNRADNELYWAFDFIVTLQPFMVDMISTCLHKNPSLVYVLLKAYPPTESLLLHEQLVDLKVSILRAILRAANALGVATLVALQKIAESINNMETSEYVELLMLAALSIRPKTLLQETLLVLHESTSASREGSPATAYLHKHALAIAFDCAEEAADVCPCDDTGRPRNTKSSYPVLRLVQTEGSDEGHVDVHFRVDLSVSIRLHSHVRLQCVSDPDNAFIDRAAVDGVVTKAFRGEITVELFHPLPPEFAVMQWRIFDAGSLGMSSSFSVYLTKVT